MSTTINGNEKMFASPLEGEGANISFPRTVGAVTSGVNHGFTAAGFLHLKTKIIEICLFVTVSSNWICKNFDLQKVNV